MTRWAIALVAGSLTGPSAWAQDINTPFSGTRPKTLELHAGFAWYGRGAAFGGRFGLPLIDSGPVTSINNALYLSVGADLYNVDYQDDRRGFAIGVPVALQWNFYFSPEWSAFFSAGVNVYIDDDPRFGFPWGIASVGGRYHLNEDIAVLLRLGSPYSSIGVDISL